MSIKFDLSPSERLRRHIERQLPNLSFESLQIVTDDALEFFADGVESMQLALDRAHGHVLNLRWAA